MRPTKTWILIADSTRATVFLHDRAGAGLQPLPGVKLSAENSADDKIAASNRGRTFNSTGDARHAMEPPTDPHKKDQHAFAKMIADLLHEHAERNDYDRLVIAAAPAMLGEIRDEMSAKVGALIHGELDKDLMNTPTEKLAAHFEDMLPV